MGFSELFATVACFEFAYFAAPRSAQSLFMSLYFCTVGLSSFIGTGYIAFFKTPLSIWDFQVSIRIG
jgi:dipeptide/tripeptide permease